MSRYDGLLAAAAVLLAAGCWTLLSAARRRRRPGYRPSRAVTALLAFLAVVGLAAGFAGAALAAYDRSPAQQRGNEWADIGVALGAAVAVSGGVAAVWAFALLAIRLWPRRAARPSSPAH